MPGVLVTLGGSSAVTDVNGNFTVQTAPGKLILQAVHRNFQAFSQTIVLAQNIAYTLQAPIKVMSVVKPL